MLAFIIYMTIFLFLGAPVAAFIWFLVSLISFLRTPKDSERKEKRKALLIASAIVAAVLFVVVVSVLAVFVMGLAYM